MTLFALVSILLVLFSFSIEATTPTEAHCHPDQHHALIQLKQGFKTTELHSWNASTDCCKWDGITCDKQTGMVTAVNLAYMFISGEVNTALFNLSSLRYLNLAKNNFRTIIPQPGFERLVNLTHLDLSNSGFLGPIPIGISALTNLISLNLSTNIDNTLYLHKPGLKTLLINLTKLQVLRLDGVKISLNASQWGYAVSQLSPTLQELSMANCGLWGNLPDEIFHLTNLRVLDLSSNSMLSDKVSDSIRGLQYLSRLILPSCSFYGEVPPSITNLTRLEILNLDSNGLTGTIPISLFSHPSLKELDLSNNQLSGFLPEFSNGSSILESIHLEHNNFEGQLPISIFKLPQLYLLSLASNNFNGTFNLDIIKHNKNLLSLDLSNNKLSIIEGKNHNKSFYTSFPQLSNLYLASCNLTKFPYFLVTQTNIGDLDLSNNNIGGVIPNWLCNITSIGYLNLSHNFITKIDGDAHFTSLLNLVNLEIHSNMISGLVPLLPPGICNADFSSNYFFSFPPYFFSNHSNDLYYLFLSNNSLMGEIPLSICNVTMLEFLVLSYNNLTGGMPPCLLENSELVELNMKNNQLSGPLPRNISQGCNFIALELSGNRINGSLPKSLMNCNNLQFLDLENNQLVDRFPFWLANLNYLRVLVLRSNQFYGKISNMEAKTKIKNSFFPSLMVLDLSSNRLRGIIPNNFFKNLKAMVNNSQALSTIPLLYYYEYDYHNSITAILKGQEREIQSTLNIFTSLDLSKNEFSGEIPKEIGQLMSLEVLDLSHNTLTGPIPSEFANLKQLESLDLSSNQLSGPIPQELTFLTFLEALNLSYNYLVGEVPQARQFSTFSNASYMGNPGLCGSPLSMKCAVAPSNHGFNKGLPPESSNDIIGLAVSIGLGFGVGFVFIIWATISWEYGRKMFTFIIDRFYF